MFSYTGYNLEGTYEQSVVLVWTLVTDFIAANLPYNEPLNKVYVVLKSRDRNDKQRISRSFSQEWSQSAFMEEVILE
ncbi:hypothetical protein EB796_005773 [Bugula neritina]|uniref:Uncharacterized protein n=1 Tax=Bugula neritina TaxID=10212 RepID=A0A7J7KDA0_BUGNE|nr:hypothetical protein EB796_005773 [Bugula neritina]